MQMEPHHDPLVYKLFGSALGTLAGLVYFKPKNLRDALGRAFFSSVTGVTCYFVPSDYLGWDITPERIIAGAFIMAIAAWPMAGLLFRWMSDKTKA